MPLEAPALSRPNSWASFCTAPKGVGAAAAGAAAVALASAAAATTLPLQRRCAAIRRVAGIMLELPLHCRRWEGTTGRARHTAPLQVLLAMASVIFRLRCTGCTAV